MTYKNIVRILLLVLIILGTVTIYLYRDGYDVGEMTIWAHNHPYSAPFLFVLLYVLLSALFFPSPIICLSGGILFGPTPGILLNLVGATFSAMAAFTVGRYLAGEVLERHLEGDLRKLKQGVDRKGWRFVLMLRLLPGLPYTLFNYALGLTRIPLHQFAAITALCILPRVIFLTYAGYSGQRLLAGKDIGGLPLLVMLVLGAVIAGSYLIKHLKRAPLI